MKAKRFLILIPVLILAFVLSGCIQTVVTLDIREDLSADVDIKMGIAEEYYDMAGGDEAFSSANFDSAEGFTVTPYQADGYKGMEAKGTVSDITQGEDTLNDMIGGSGVITVGQAQNGNKTIEVNIPTEGITGEVAGETGYSMQDLASYGNMDMRIIITLPYEVKETNATSQSGRTLTWDLLKFEGTMMTAVAEQGGFAFPIWLIIVIIIAVVAVIVILLLLRARKNKQAAGNNGSYTSQYTDRYNGPGYNNNDAAGTQYGGAADSTNYSDAGSYTSQYENNNYNEQSYNKPTYNEPTYNEPTYNEPTYNEPTYNEPTYNEPAYNEPDDLTPQADMPEYEAPQADSPEAEDVLSGSVSMNFCPQCGSKLPASGMFCPKCGCKL